MEKKIQFSVYSSDYIDEPNDAILYAERSTIEEAEAEQMLHDFSVIVKETLEEVAVGNEKVFTITAAEVVAK